MAWGGLELPVPTDWEIASHGNEDGVYSLTLEDSSQVRLQLDWALVREARAYRQLKAKAEHFTKQIFKLSSDNKVIEGFPSGWNMTHSFLDNGLSVIFGMMSVPEIPVKMFIRVRATDTEFPLKDVAKKMASGFAFHESGSVPWRLYDLAIKVPYDFKLQSVSLIAGRKMLLFEKRARRLWIWRFSLVSHMLRGRSVVEGLISILNTCAAFPGIKFCSSPSGEIHMKRRLIHRFGHLEEIIRWCFKYDVYYEYDANTDALLARVFQYRKDSDLNWLEGLHLKDGSTR